MKRKLLMMALLGGTLAAGTALADDECSAPMSTWQPREAVAEKARSMGWHVRRIRTDDGCYKVYARDAAGRVVEAEFDPATLDLIELEIEDHQEAYEEDEEREEGSGRSGHGEGGSDGHGDDGRTTGPGAPGEDHDDGEN